MTYVITTDCVDVKDKTCVTECPVDCIYEGPRSLYIHPDECIDCGACEPVCPTDAVFAEWSLPEEQQQQVDVARDMFAEIGSPNGAKRHGLLDKDHPSIEALPPQAPQE